MIPANFEEFYTRYLQLLDSLPKPPLHNQRCDNCEWGDFNYTSKNLLYAFDNARCQDGTYLNSSYLATSCLDCDYAVESELCYDSVDPVKSFNTHFCNYCVRLRDSYYCYACGDSHHLFGCIYLGNKSHCIFNRQYSEQEYEEKVKELLQQSPYEIYKKVDELIDHFPMTQTKVTRSENCDYCNQVHYSKNMFLCFDAVRSQDCGYVYDSHNNRDCWDMVWSVRNELSYQVTDSGELYDCAFINYSDRCRNSWFLYNCRDIKSCFGCANLVHKEYCLLNQQFSPEKYKEVVTKLKSDLKLSAPQISRW